MKTETIIQAITTDQLRQFVGDPGTNLTTLCREAGVSKRQIYYVLAGGIERKEGFVKYKFNDRLKAKLVPVMLKRGLLYICPDLEPKNEKDEK